ncbi:MAG: HAMP domain-containing histidine kinase [Roseburia sp.]|nr:HAMP domain-containing histidine kinase [Roseburia sp.]MCM1097856.1 HAMP domain-containing histidine kinase [Ruminococcus flavefaciens]
MKSIPKLIRRFAGILLASSTLLLALNLLLLVVYTMKQVPNASPWKTAEEAAAGLRRTKNGYLLSEEMTHKLKEADAWAILIDNATGQAVWRTENLPEAIPLSYSLSEIPGLTRGYIADYPTFPAAAEGGLLVLGYPKKSFWKHMWPSWDYELIANLPKTAFSVLAVNLGLIFLIYVLTCSRLLKSVRPIVSGIQALPAGEEIRLPERGLLSELAASLNKASELLQSQGRQLRKRETARANWIAGVSHDIRTPLSMVMGYAGQLEEDDSLPEDSRKKAGIIVGQSERIRNLINDLNLACKLEYNMQPVRLERQNLIAVVRQVTADFMNLNLEEKDSITWETDETLTSRPVTMDRELIKRAVGNLIQNSVSHNGQGCHIRVRVMAEEKNSLILVSDDGIGATDEQLEKLNHAPHYMVCDENIDGQRHGLGLLLVRQILDAHKGEMQIRRSESGGFEVELRLPDL